MGSETLLGASLNAGPDNVQACRAHQSGLFYDQEVADLITCCFSCPPDLLPAGEALSAAKSL
jgi:hypothetical protein